MAVKKPTKAKKAAKKFKGVRVEKKSREEGPPWLSASGPRGNRDFVKAQRSIAYR